MPPRNLREGQGNSVLPPWLNKWFWSSAEEVSGKSGDWRAVEFSFKKPQSCYTEQFDFPVDTMYIKFNTASNAYIHVHFIDLGCLTGIKCVLWILDLLLFKLFC